MINKPDMTTEQRIQAAIEHSKKGHLAMAIQQLLVICHNQQQEINVLNSTVGFGGPPLYEDLVNKTEEL